MNEESAFAPFAPSRDTASGIPDLKDAAAWAAEWPAAPSVVFLRWVQVNARLRDVALLRGLIQSGISKTPGVDAAARIETEIWALEAKCGENYHRESESR